MAEQPKFTKGPWKQINGGFHISAKGQPGKIASAHEIYMDKAARLANARLIAAGPDLYGAFVGDPEMPEPIRPINWLHSLIQDCKERGPSPDNDDPSAYWDMISEVEALYELGKAAIAKAEGRDV